MEQFGHWIYGVHVKQDLMLVHCMLKITQTNSAIVFYQAQLPRKWSKNGRRKSIKGRVHFKLVNGMPYKDFGIP